MAWYNDYRPTNFDEVIGQHLVKTVLQNSLKQTKIKHGYLLSGPKGVGKTTIARIFANELNDLGSNPQASMDIIELDAASNSGVDNIRQLIDSAQTPPFAGKYKVFIIDEVHMLSKSAMNALLKILEEPPVYLVFLLATTNPEKLLPTVLSRLTKLALSSHTIDDIVSQLTMIAIKEKMAIDNQSLQLIAKRANGGQRDAINLLETLHSYSLEKYTIKETSNLLGLVGPEIFDQVSETLLTQNFVQIKSIIQEIENVGLDGEGFLAQYLDYLLESVFTNQNSSQQLILPVASILNMKLPINTIHSSFALIQSEISKSSFVTNLPTQTFITNTINDPKLNIDLTEKKTEFLLENDTLVETQSNNEGILKSTELQTNLLSLASARQVQNDASVSNDVLGLVETPSDNEEILKSTELQTNLLGLASARQVQNDGLSLVPLPDELAERESVAEQVESYNNGEVLENKIPKIVTQVDIKKYFSEILQLKNCPPPLKIVSNDINIESVEDNQIKFSISSPIFLPQVKNEKTLKFINEFLLEKLGNQFSIEIVLRDPSLKNISAKPVMESTQQNYNILEPVVEINEPVFEIKKEKIFYKIYGGAMPDNNISDISNMKFYNDKVNVPENVEILTKSENSWNEEIGNIFDF
jgi:DNA polymerase III subunit gamma/tau